MREKDRVIADKDGVIATINREKQQLSQDNHHLTSQLQTVTASSTAEIQRLRTQLEAATAQVQTHSFNCDLLIFCLFYFNFDIIIVFICGQIESLRVELEERMQSSKSYKLREIKSYNNYKLRFIYLPIFVVFFFNVRF